MKKKNSNKIKKSDLFLTNEERQQKKLKEWIKINLIIFLGLSSLFIISMFDDKGSVGYYKTQNYIFIGCVGVLIVMLITRYDLLRMIKNIIHPENNKLILFNDWIVLLSYIMSIFGLIFIDTSFFENYGIRISGVVAVNLAIVIKGLIASNKIKWTLK